VSAKNVPDDAVFDEALSEAVSSDGSAAESAGSNKAGANDALTGDTAANVVGAGSAGSDGAGAGGAGADGATRVGSASGDAGAAHGVLPLWRNRDYAGWWVSSLVSSLGTAMSQLAYPLLMLYATGSVARAGIVGACLNIGGLSTTLLGGALADRYSRRWLVVGADVVQAVVVTSVVIAVAQGYVNVVHIGAVALVQGMANGISGASMTPVLKRIASAEQFPALSASKQGRDMISRLVGPPLGGALFTIGKWIPFLGDAVSFVVSAIGIAVVRRPLGPDAEDRAAHTSTLGSMREGFAYIGTSVYLRFIVVWTALTSALLGGMVLLVIALIKQRGGGPTTIGVVTSLAAVGGVGGALVAPLLLKRIRSRTLVLSASWTIVVATVGIAAAPRPWEIGAISAFLVFLIVPLTVLLESYQLRIVPDALMGRVSSALSFGTSGLLWTAPIIAGVLADNVGVPTAMLVLAGAFVGLGVWSTLARAVRLLDQ
jgi:MFS family permease